MKIIKKEINLCDVKVGDYVYIKISRCEDYVFYAKICEIEIIGWYMQVTFKCDDFYKINPMCRKIIIAIVEKQLPKSPYYNQDKTFIYTYNPNK